MPKNDRRREARSEKGPGSSAVERRRRERRGNVRVPVSLWVEEKKENDLYFQQAGNLSLGGLFFERTIPHPIGTKVRLKFELPGKEGVIQTIGEVVSIPDNADGFGAGVKFIGLDPVEQRLIEEYIRENQQDF